jgi:hypothetical protein
LGASFKKSCLLAGIAQVDAKGGWCGRGHAG